MIKGLLYIILFLLFSVSAFSTSARIYTSSKKGITIRYVALDDSLTQGFLDKYLDRIIEKLNGAEISFNVLVMIDDVRVRKIVPAGTYKNYVDVNLDFTAVAVDKLTLNDQLLIEDYCQFKQHEKIDSTEQIFFARQKNPIDVFASLSDTTRSIGIRIIANTDIWRKKTNWAEIEKLILFSIVNKTAIEKEQKRIKAFFYPGGCEVSLLSIDSNKIAAVKKAPLVTFTKKTTLSMGCYPMLLALFAFTGFYYWPKKKVISRKLQNN